MIEDLTRPTRDLTRKGFCASLLAGWALLALPGCGGGGGDYGGSPAPAPAPPAPAPGPAAICGNTIADNHGHALVLTRSDLDAAAGGGYGMDPDLSVDIRGTAPHTHRVVLSAAQQATLRAGGTVNVVSSLVEAHTHAVTVTCT